MSKRINSQVQFLMERPNPALGKIFPFETQEYKGGPLVGGRLQEDRVMLRRLGIHDFRMRANRR